MLSQRLRPIFLLQKSFCGSFKFPSSTYAIAPHCLSMQSSSSAWSGYTHSFSSQASESPSPPKRQRIDSSSPSPPSSPPRSGSTSEEDMASGETQSPPVIELTPLEETIRQLLVDCAAHIDTTSNLENETLTSPVIPTDTPIELRFTGGWVRDKLLKGESHDIDVGINKMTGYDFGNRLQVYISTYGTKYGIETGARGVHKIESNPEKSKHLETATTKILGLDIDLVNLRSEAYNGNSRIPIMEFGTPLQDAMRRDATVNALFYNLHTKQVEDFTGRGLEDLEKGLIRTPLKPWETFHDDPLRILRLVRFASRLGFEIVEEVKEAMKDDGIRKVLRVKISRERVGTEVEKMLKGRDPYRALQLIHELELSTAIFCPLVETVPNDLPIDHMVPAIDAVNHLFTTTSTPFSNLKSIVETPHERYLAWNISAVIPWAGRFVGEKKIPAAAIAAREGLKMNNKDYDVLVAAYKNVDMVRKTVEEIWRISQGAVEGEEKGREREKAGLCVRACGASWHSQVLCAALVEVVGLSERGKHQVELEKARDEIFRKYDKFVQRVMELGVEDAYALKAIMNGKDICKLLNRKSGPWMKYAVEKLMAWQLRNPELGKDKAKEFVLSEGFSPQPEGP